MARGLSDKRGSNRNKPLHKINHNRKDRIKWKQMIFAKIDIKAIQTAYG